MEQLRESRQHQMQLVDSIVRQRDMYRILLSQITGVNIPLQGIFLYLILEVCKYFWEMLLRCLLGNGFCNISSIHSNDGNLKFEYHV